MAPLFNHFYPKGVTGLCHSQVGCWRYNLRSLAFLQEQMDKLNSFQGISEMLDSAKVAEEGSARRACYKRLSHAMSLWEMLICHHNKGLQPDNFYTAEEVQVVVQEICSSLLAFAEECGFDGVRIENCMPPKDVDDDRRALEERLGYILGLKKYSLDGFPEDIVEESKQAKAVHEKQLSRMFFADEEIVVGQWISGTVYSCKRRGREYVVKNVVRCDGNHQDLVGLARLYTATKASINSPAVVRLYGFTGSGKLVMEKGVADILTWFKHHRSGGMKLKLQLLQNAASALADVHHEGIVHRDVRLGKFIVFKGNPLEVKIRLLQFSTNSSADANNVVSEAGAVKCGAPEVLHGAPNSFLSDIYSFGIVANMLVAEMQLYRTGTPHSVLSQRKTVGQPPWELPSDCPTGLAEFIAECCSVVPAARPPSMEDVYERLTTLAQCYEASRDTAVQNPAILEEPLHELASAKYNKNMMGFLSRQLEKVHALKAPRGASKDYLKEFENAREKGHRLIRKHEERVDISTFYQSVEARDIVEHVCDSLYVVAREWGLKDTQNVKVKVPGKAFSEDRDTLAKLLNFVLRGVHEDFVSFAEIPQEWQDSRKEHVARMKGLPEVDDEEICQAAVVGEGGVSVVHSCTYRGNRVAMKEFVKKGGEVDIENMATFFKDVLVHMSLRDGHVAKLLAITKSGSVLMELADMDLKAFCRKFCPKWPWNVRILLQAAKCLRYMHGGDRPMAHCDVKSPNFLVFGSDVATCIVKITDFGLTCEVTEARWKTARRPRGTCLWVAPEVFEGELLSLPSDVYSFGLIMYEIVTGKELYGLQSVSQPDNDQHIMKKKLDGQEPCVVDPADCPEEMHSLMKECCHLDPEKRPTMAEVCSRLSVLQMLRTDKVHAQKSLHRTLWGSIIPMLFSFKSCIVWCLAAILFQTTRGVSGRGKMLLCTSILTAAIWEARWVLKIVTLRPRPSIKDLKKICGRQLDQRPRESIPLEEAHGFTFPKEYGWDEATILLEQGAELMAQHKYPEAERKYRSALDKREKELEFHLKKVGRVEPQVQKETEASRRSRQQFGEMMSQQIGQGNRQWKATGPEDNNTPDARGWKLKAKHLGVAECLHSIGCACQSQGDFKEAVKHYTRALEIQELQLGESDACLTGSLGNLAEALYLDGHLSEAERCYQRQLDKTGKALGDRHPDCAACLNKLGEVLEEQQQMEKAEKVYDEALDIYEAACRPLESAVTMCNLVLVCRKLAKVPDAKAKDKLEKAERMHRAAQKLYDEWLPGVVVEEG